MSGAFAGAKRSSLLGKRLPNPRVALVQTLTNAAALAITVQILPGVDVHSRYPVLALLLIAVVFGLLNAFVKPVIHLVALPLLLGSLGLVLVVVDALILWLLDLVFPSLFSVDGIGRLFAAAVVVGLLSFLFDGALGLAPPIVDDSRSGGTLAR
jgi:putative membrane protein